MAEETEVQVDPRQHAHNEAVAAFERQHAEWDEMIRQIGLDRMDEPGVMGEWSAKDLIAHLAGWQWKTIESFKSALGGTTEYPETPWPDDLNMAGNWEEDGDYEAINQWIHDQTTDDSADDVIQQARDQWNELRGIVAGLSIDQMEDPQLFVRTEGRSLGDLLRAAEFSGHFTEHYADDVEPWLEANGRRF